MTSQTIAIQQYAHGPGIADLPLDPVYIHLPSRTVTAAELLRRAVLAQSQRQREELGLATDSLNAVLRAQHAFTQQNLALLVNGRPIEDLDELVVCTPQTFVILVRHAPLG